MQDKRSFKVSNLEADNLLVGTSYMKTIHEYFGMPVTEFPQGYEFHVIGPQKMRLYHINGYDEKYKIMTFRNLPAKNFEVLGSRYAKAFGSKVVWGTWWQWMILWLIVGIIVFNLTRL